MIGLGLLFAAAGIGYLVYAELARSRLDELIYVVPQIERADWLVARLPETTAAKSGPSGISDVPVEPADPALAGAALLFPARWTNPRYWSEPEWAGSAPYGAAGLPDGFVYVNPADITAASGETSEFGKSASRAAAETLEIKAIGLSTTVYGLTVRNDGDQLLWDSPVNIVGHIPGTAQPGETGAGWYFGHLQSPVSGEGNVFSKLPDVVDLLRYDPVDIIIGSADGEFLYRVTRTGFIHRDDLVLAETSEATVTLVSSYPKFVYDHRLLVTGELLAFRPPQ
ncbi:MAG: sortase [Chloroflexi bacterium]|nr:sortase [Chloroflexota bacterium]